MDAQSYLSFYHDNYAGVQSVLFNPATIADSRFKTDINLFSVSSSVGNDLYGVPLSDVFKGDYDFDKQSRFTPATNNNAIVNFDFMGPSFMFNIAPKHTLAVFTRARSIANVTQVNGSLVDQVKDGLDKSSNFNFNGGSPNTVSNSWGELGISYATVLFQKRQHFLKGGFTVKYLQGVTNGYLQGNNLDVTLVANPINPKFNRLYSKGELTIGGSQDFNADTNVNFDINSRGVGFDMGLVYEWRPDYSSYDLNNAKAVDNNFRDLNKYKLRFGLSVIDIGSINYKNAIRDTYNLTGSFVQDDIDNADDIYEFLNKHYAKTTTAKGLMTNLPTALHADLDWSIHNKFYLNLNGDISLVGHNKLNGNSIADRVSLTPRYESRWFSFYVPITWMEYSGTQVGSGIRVGTFFLGSSSVLTNLIAKESKAVDFYIGFKIPVYEKKFKDTDGDGVLDKIDGCRKIAGPIENNGCPWSDADGDLVFDKDDACVNLAGPVVNKGCPWNDSDGDTLLDNVDACPRIAGPVENRGCPWSDTDKDGVLDKDDNCPTVAGAAVNRGCPEVVLIEIKDSDKDGVEDKEDDCPTIAGSANNKGCPVVTEAIVEKLKIQARLVYFNTGRATLQGGGVPARLKAIGEILKSYPNAKFSIEGHTDNIGSEKVNKKLSHDRANAIKKVLIQNGVNPENVEAKGFGSTVPVGDNKIKSGRAKNRRTEIRHVDSKYEGKL